MPETVQSVLDRALDAYTRLAERGEQVDDEWSYVNDLADAWRERLDDVLDRRAEEPLSEPVVVALDRVIAEVALIEDPHRAIDWLSTFPQVVLLALAEPP